MPDLSGRLALVTGANSGLGYVTARELARRGARVVLACRDPGRGAAALGQMQRELPDARLELRPLDLASLASIRAFAERWDAGPLDLLINNAGIALVPRSRTEDGFEAAFRRQPSRAPSRSPASCCRICWPPCRRGSSR